MRYTVDQLRTQRDDWPTYKKTLFDVFFLAMKNVLVLQSFFFFLQRIQKGFKGFKGFKKLIGSPKGKYTDMYEAQFKINQKFGYKQKHDRIFSL